MNTNVKFHARIPLGMVKGNKDRVWLKNGKELRVIVTGKGRYVRVSSRSYKGYKMYNVDRLYLEIHDTKKKALKYSYASEVNSSKSALREANRTSSPYINNKARNPIISLSGYVLYGKHKGKKLKELSLEDLKWYIDNQNLNRNEMLEIDNELKRREK